MAGPTKRTSIKEVADALGVSKTLVSLVINNKGDDYGISKETQRRVSDKVKELNYHPNLIAKALRTGKTNTIALIVPDIANIFYARIAKAIERQAIKNGYHLIIASSEEDPQQEENLIQWVTERQQADGLILATTEQTGDNFNTLIKQRFPLVLFDRSVDAPAHKVLVDNRKGAYTATEAMIESGKRRLRMLSITPGHLSTIQERIAGFVDALNDNKMSLEDAIINIPFDRVNSAVSNYLDNALKSDVFPDGIFTANNTVALAVIGYLQKHNIAVPKKTAVVSFDDIDLFSLINPPVTAIAQPIEELANKAVDLLLKSIESKDVVHEEFTLPVDLIRRESV